MTFSRLPPDEIERRRLASMESLKGVEREAFAEWYQEKCDEKYWAHGQCCFGCDHWSSDMGNLGNCLAAGIVPGDQVNKSLGFWSASYIPPPGLPFTEGSFYCGKFRDDFDWSTLPDEYLTRIGAMAGGKVLPKPTKRAKGGQS